MAWRPREATIGKGGLLPARDLQNTFSFLRANDLVWNYVTGNYLKGQKPQAFDLLYWNSDSTNLPGPFACWYMRNMYLENNLRVPGKLAMCGQKVDLGQLDMPVYLLATREDHIVPWQSAYQSTRILGGKARFVLGASGHIAGVINPASKNKRSYWLNDDVKIDAEGWLTAAEERKGSWWTDWAAWLKPLSGEQGHRANRGSQIQADRTGARALRQGTRGIKIPGGDQDVASCTGYRRNGGSSARQSASSWLRWASRW
jgi:polyhydroxyalkanoate synthase